MGNEEFAFSTPICPISAQSQLNIDALCSLIINHLPKYSPSLIANNCSLKKSDLLMTIIRSFDANKAKNLNNMAAVDSICGGVIGGAVLNGHIAINQCIEIRPGYLAKTAKNEWKAMPIRTSVKSLKYGKSAAAKGYSGGNVGVQTNIDPSLTKSDRMCGHIVIDSNHPNPPPIFVKFIMSYSFLCDVKVPKFKKKEIVRINVGSFKMRAEIIGNVKEYKDAVLLCLEAPICARVGDKVGICRQNKKREWLFCGGGIVRKTKNIRIESDIFKKSVNVNPTNDDLLKQQSKELVHLRYQQRTSKKGITTIIGLAKNVNVKKLMIRMKKAFNCGATLIDNGNAQIIQIQGDLRNDISQMIQKLNIVKKRTNCCSRILRLQMTAYSYSKSDLIIFFFANVSFVFLLLLFAIHTITIYKLIQFAFLLLP